MLDKKTKRLLEVAGEISETIREHNLGYFWNEDEVLDIEIRGRGKTIGDALIEDMNLSVDDVEDVFEIIHILQLKNKYLFD